MERRLDALRDHLKRTKLKAVAEVVESDRVRDFVVLVGERAGLLRCVEKPRATDNAVLSSILSAGEFHHAVLVDLSAEQDDGWVCKVQELAASLSDTAAVT